MRRNLTMREGGVPLYIEEMLYMFVDDDILIPDGDETRWVCSAGAQSITLPMSILSGMISQLDRFERPMRNVLCQCAVEGVEFASEVTESMSRSQQDQGRLS